MMRNLRQKRVSPVGERSEAVSRANLFDKETSADDPRKK